MKKYLNFSFFLSAILFFWLIQTPTGFAHPVALSKFGGCPDNHVIRYTVDGNLCVHDEAIFLDPNSVHSGEQPIYFTKDQLEQLPQSAPRQPICPAGYDPVTPLDLTKLRPLCRNAAGQTINGKYECPFYYRETLSDVGITKISICTKLSETELTTGQLNIDTTGYTPYICFKEGSLPTVGEKTCPEQKLQEGIAQYIARIYQFSLMVVGLLALAGLIFGAVKYILSAGNIVSQEDARDQIKASIIGLLILLGAYLILSTINPDLVRLKNPTILNLPPVQDTTGATPEKQRLPSNNPSGGSGQNASAPTANIQSGIAARTRTATCNITDPRYGYVAGTTFTLGIQPGCTSQSSCGAKTINGVSFWACFACNESQGYKNQDGICIK